MTDTQKDFSSDDKIWKAIVREAEGYDHVSINGNKYQIRPTSNGFQAWAQDSGHWIKITEFGDMTHDECLRDIISNAYWRLRR